MESAPGRGSALRILVGRCGTAQARAERAVQSRAAPAVVRQQLGSP